MGVNFAYLLEPEYPVFGIGEPVAAVAKSLVEKGIECAPLLDDGSYAGVVFLSGLLRGRNGWPPAREKLEQAMIEVVPAYRPEEQLFDNLLAISTVRSPIVPVVDAEGRYAGVVTRRRILGFLADRIHSGEGGSTMEIEVPPSGAKLSEIIETLEKNDASVLSFTSWPAGEDGKGRIIFFRIATHDFFRLVRNMENYGYLIRYHSAFPDAGYDELREKALEFIRYMDM